MLPSVCRWLSSGPHQKRLLPPGQTTLVGDTLITSTSHLPLLCCSTQILYSFFLSLCIALPLVSFLICLLTLASHLLLLLKVLIPRFSVELLRQTEAAALSFASELRETEEKEKRHKREGDMVGRLIHV